MHSTTPYRPDYDSSDIRSSNYNVMDHVGQIYRHPTVQIALDMGAGTCRKTSPIVNNLIRFDAIDLNVAMLKRARHNLESAGATNYRLVVGNNLQTPFAGASYDLISCFLTHYNTAEIHRVLRPGGYLIIETIGPEDKRQLKEAFGADDLGPRGMYLNLTHEQRLQHLIWDLAPLFTLESFELVRFSNHLTRSGVERILDMTPTVRGYDSSADAPIVDSLFPENLPLEIMEERMILVCRPVAGERLPDLPKPMMQA